MEGEAAVSNSILIESIQEAGKQYTTEIAYVRSVTWQIKLYSYVIVLAIFFYTFIQFFCLLT